MMKISKGLLAASLLCSTASFADEDKEQEVSKSVSISVTTNSESSSSDDGEPRSSFSGKIVVVGPDGEKKEYDLGDKFPPGFRRMNIGDDNLSMWFQKDAIEERYMLGVMCDLASDVLKNHLKLDGHGLVVTQVSENMPAAEAGIANGDILLTVDGKRLEKLEDLVNAVVASEGKELKLTVLKSGERHELTVTPKKSTGQKALGGLPQDQPTFFFGANADDEVIKGLEDARSSMIIRRIGPGIRLQDEGRVELEKVLEFAQEAAKDSESGDMQKELDSLRKRLAALEQQLKSMKPEQAPEE